MTRPSWIVGVLLGTAAVASGNDDEASPIRSDERVVFFPTAARPTPDGSAWIVPVHGWIFEPEGDDLLRAMLRSKLRKSLGVAEETRAGEVFDARAQLFLVDNERGKRVGVRIAGRTVVLPPSGPNGHFQRRIRLGEKAVRPFLAQRRLTLKAVLAEDDEREFVGEVLLVPEASISVISDIDDTVKLSNVLDKQELVANTFLRPFAAVDGMAQRYRHWSEQGAAFHFVSSSPWQLYEPLAEFLGEEGFPSATFHLQLFRFKDSTFLNLFADPVERKSAVLLELFTAFPAQRFVLVGDSGEKDPEVYGRIARAHPERVAAIYIRDVTGEPRDAPRYAQAFQDIPPARWLIFTDPGLLAWPGDEGQ